MQIKRIQHWINKNTYISIVISLILILIPILRSKNNMYQLMGQVSFFHEYIIKNYLLFIENGKTNLYHLMMYTFSFFLKLEFLEVWIPIFFGVITLTLIWIIIKKEEPNKIYSIMLILGLSPPFLYIFSHNGPYSIILFLYALYFLLFKKNNILQYLIAIIIASQSLLDSLIIVLIPYLFKKKDKINLMLVGIINLIQILLFYHIPNYFVSPLEPSYIQNISSLNGLIGLGLFTVILASIGLVKISTIKKRYAIFTLLSLTLWNYSLYPQIILTILASYGFYRLILQKWNLKELKIITIFTLICSFIFIGIAYTNVIVNETPSNNLINSINKIKYDNGVSYNNQKIGLLINSRTKLKSLCTFLKCNKSIYNNITYNRNLKETKNVIKKNNIKYLFITEKSKTWENKDDGLLFILRDKVTFDKILKNKEIEIIKTNVS